MNVEFPLETTPPTGSPLYAGVSKAVVEFPLLAVAQNLVGFGGLTVIAFRTRGR